MGGNLKEKLTAQELKFIEYHLVMGFTVRKSMILAGYEESSEGMYFYRAKKIIRKFEVNEEDHRNIMRALGAGETFVIAGMVDLAKNATSERAKAQALTRLGKWLGMGKETIQGSQGVTVIIQGYDAAQQQVNVHPQAPTPQPGYNHPKPNNPDGSVTIMK